MAVKIVCRPETARMKGKRFILGDALDKTGDFGVFYKCTEEKKEKEFLLKETSSALRWCWRDHDTWSQFGHPNILRYEDSWVIQQARQELLYVLCETAQMSLEYLLFSMSPERPSHHLFSKWLFHIASALEYMHNKNNDDKPVLHRNLRPSSIMVSSDCVLKVFGFGLSKRLKNQDAVTKTVVGGDLFQSPEIKKGRQYDKSSDMWSLGVTSAYIASYEEATNARTSEQVREKRRFFHLQTPEANEIITLLTDSGQESGVIELVVESLDKKPTCRITAAQLVNKLSKICGTCILEPPDKSTYPAALNPKPPKPEVDTSKSVSTQTGPSLFIVKDNSWIRKIECPELRQYIEIQRRLHKTLGDKLFNQALEEGFQKEFKELIIQAGINYRDVLKDLKLLKSLESKLQVNGLHRDDVHPDPDTYPIRSNPANKQTVPVPQADIPRCEGGLGQDVLIALKPFLVKQRSTSLDLDSESGLGESM